MAQLTLLKKDFSVKDAYLGISWTILLFGSLVPYTRGHIVNGIIMSLFQITSKVPIILLSQDLHSFKTHKLLPIIIIINVFYRIIFCFTYNNIYLFSLLHKGYIPVDPTIIPPNYTRKVVPFWLFILLPNTSLLIESKLYTALTLNFIFLLLFVFTLPLLELSSTFSFFTVCLYLIEKVLLALLFYPFTHRINHH